MSQKKINGYVIFMKDILGKGSYGSVYRGQQENTKLQVAVKVLQKKLIDHDQYLKAALFSQIQIMQLFKQQNIVRVLDVMESSHNYYIIQEICESDLQKYIDHHPNTTEETALEILKQICNGFLALVKEGVVHRDLKPANILFSKGVAKIGDFGFAKKNVTKRIKNATSVGTPLYMSPQILKSEPYTSKCDVWAIGFIFYEMIHHRTPWTAHTEFQLVKNIETKPLKINDNLKPQTKDFITRCLQLTEQKRLSWDEVFLHPIFKGYFKKYAEQNQQFENKLKMVMSELRFQINSKNIDLNKLFNSMGYKPNHQLNFKEFSQFVRVIHPSIVEEEIKFFFEKMDYNTDGNISLQELSQEMEKHRISFSKGYNPLQENTSTSGGNIEVKKTQSLQQNFSMVSMSSELQHKVKKCFIKLYKILSSKKMTLYKVFSAYDLDRSGELTIEEFQKIMKRLDNTFTHDQIQAVFEFIDVDHSKTVEFDELNSYYCKVNSIPQALELPPDYFLKNVKKKY